MENEEFMEEYSRSVTHLLEYCVGSGISEDEFKKIYFDCLKEVQKENEKPTPFYKKIFTKQTFMFLTIFIVIMISLNFKYVYSYLQEFIYPAMKVFRKISIPFISLFPSLTEMYHETCLVQNPFFTVVDMECWPCNAITSINILDEPLQNSQQHTAPFVYKTDQKKINVKQLSDMFYMNEKMFNKEASKVLTNGKYYQTPKEMFEMLQNTQEKNSFLWKFNTMDVARVVRQLIPRPKVVPKFGQSTERFLLIDNSKEAFQIPDTECNYAFVLALSGSRTIDLRPADECQHQCKTLRVDLMETYLLWYNWWYWKPMVLPSSGNNTLILHVGSYC